MSARKEVAVTAASDGKQSAQRENVVLTKDHTHGRKQYVAGDTIAVWPQQKEWLQRLGKIGPSTQGETK